MPRTSRPISPGPFHIVSTRIDETDLERVREHARRNERSVGATVRVALRELLMREEAMRGGAPAAKG